MRAAGSPLWELSFWMCNGLTNNPKVLKLCQATALHMHSPRNALPTLHRLAAWALTIGSFGQSSFFQGSRGNGSLIPTLPVRVVCALKPQASGRQDLSPHWNGQDRRDMIARKSNGLSSRIAHAEALMAKKLFDWVKQGEAHFMDPDREDRLARKSVELHNRMAALGKSGFELNSAIRNFTFSGRTATLPARFIKLRWDDGISASFKRAMRIPAAFRATSGSACGKNTAGAARSAAQTSTWSSTT